LVEENAAEVVTVWEDIVLSRQVGTPRVHEVDAGKVVLLGDLLCPEKSVAMVLQWY
jgi:hypothetical protein